MWIKSEHFDFNLVTWVGKDNQPNKFCVSDLQSFTDPLFTLITPIFLFHVNIWASKNES